MTPVSLSQHLSSTMCRQSFCKCMFKGKEASSFCSICSTIISCFFWFYDSCFYSSTSAPHHVSTIIRRVVSAAQSSSSISIRVTASYDTLFSYELQNIDMKLSTLLHYNAIVCTLCTICTLVSYRTIDCNSVVCNNAMHIGDIRQTHGGASTPCQG